MTVVIALAFGASGALAAIVHALRHAPEGFETADGFHFVNQPNEQTSLAHLNAPLRPARAVSKVRKFA